jgi:hypothetical protein
MVQELASSSDLSQESVERQDIVAKYLNRIFLGKAGSITKEHRGIGIEVVGAAIERAGKIVDALQFYESLERDGQTEDVRRFAGERLVRNLERHADYLQSRNDDGQLRQRQRAQQLRERLQLGDRKLNDYPTLTPIPSASNSPTEWTRGPFRLIVSRAHGRVRIEHTERFETITVQGKERRLLGDAGFTPIVDYGDGEAAWEIAEWGAKVVLVTRPTGPSVIFDDGSLFEITLG